MSRNMSNTQNGSATPAETMRIRPPSSADPAESLAYEAAIARAAMAAKFQELRTSLQTAADPREWAERHPWVAVSVAAATGFAAATAIASERNGRRRDDRRRAAEEDFARDRGGVAPNGAASSGWTAMLFDLAKILFNSQLLPMFQAWQQSMAEQAGPTAQPAAGAEAMPSTAAGAGAAAPGEEDRFASGYNPNGASHNGRSASANGPGMGVD